jgi:hypothetical protein
MNLPANAFQQASFVNCRIWADSNGDDALSVLRGVNGECHGTLPSDEHTSYSVDQRRRHSAGMLRCINLITCRCTSYGTRRMTAGCQTREKLKMKSSQYRPSCRSATRLAEVASSKQVFQDLVPCRLAEKQEDQGTAAHFPLELIGRHVPVHGDASGD